MDAGGLRRTGAEAVFIIFVCLKECKPFLGGDALRYSTAYIGLERKDEIVSMATEIMSRGMKCLMEQLGVVDAECFVATVIQEKFDYTRWQRECFDGKSSEEICREAEMFEKNPYTGNT